MIVLVIKVVLTKGDYKYVFATDSDNDIPKLYDTIMNSTDSTSDAFIKAEQAAAFIINTRTGQYKEYDTDENDNFTGTCHENDTGAATRTINFESNNNATITEKLTNQEVKDELLRIVKSMDIDMYSEADYGAIDFAAEQNLQKRLDEALNKAKAIFETLGITKPEIPSNTGGYNDTQIKNYFKLAEEACDFETFYSNIKKSAPNKYTKFDDKANEPWEVTPFAYDTTKDPQSGEDKLTTINNILLIENVLNTYGEPKVTYIDKNDHNNNGEAKAQWYINMFDKIEACGYHTLKDGLASSSEWITFAFESGIVGMEQIDVGNNWNPIIYSNCSDITEKTDEVAVARAEAEYKSAMNKIENKDKRYDLELKNIDTEHNSLQTEYDSIKNAISKNIERTFKIYS